MANFIKAGSTRINLDQVLTIEEGRNVKDPNSPGKFLPGIRVRFGGTDRETIELGGDDAKALIAAIDKPAK